MKADAHRRSIVEKIRRENEKEYGAAARRTVQTLLSAGHPHPWMYVYELTQNALDAGAKRVSWQTGEDQVLFQHDGDVKLNEAHVRGIASLCASSLFTGSRKNSRDGVKVLVLGADTTTA